jgi:uncharacterized protein (TIRG00374 family)
VTAATRRGARRVLYGLQAVIAAALLWWILRRVDATVVVRIAGQANLALVLAGTGIFFLGQIVAARRWKSILGSGNVSISTWRVLKINLIGAFAANFLPGMGGGDVVKGMILFPGREGRRTFIMSSVLFDRLGGLAAMLLIAAAASFWLGATGHGWAPMQWVGVAAAGIAVLACGLWLITRFSGTATGKLSGAAERLRQFSRHTRDLAFGRRLAVQVLLLSLAFQLSWIVAQWCMLRSIAHDAPFLAVAVASPLSLLAAILPLSLNGLGVREGVFSGMLVSLGVTPEQAVAAAMLSLLPLLLSSVVGALFLGNLRAST